MIKKMSSVMLFVSILYSLETHSKSIELSDLMRGSYSNNIEIKNPNFQQNNENPMVDRLNDIRRKFGLPNLNKNSSLMKAAANHSYYLTYKKDISHYQIKGDSYFTGETPIDRAVYAGYNKNKQYIKVGEVVAMYSGKQNKDDLDNFLMAIYHRLTILNPTFTDYGELRISDGNINISELKVGTTYENNNITYTYYPYSNMNNVPTVFYPYQEDPNPMPDYDKVGYPISFQLSDGNRLKVKSFNLKDSKGQVINGKIMNSGNDKHISSSQFAFIPYEELNGNEVYKVSLIGNANDGDDFSLSWLFKTSERKKPVINIPKENYSPMEIVSISYENVSSKKVKTQIETVGGNKILLTPVSNETTWGLNQFNVLHGCKRKNGCEATFSLIFENGEKISKNFKIMPN